MAKEAKQAQFLREFAARGDTVEARKAAGIPRQTVSRWFSEDEAFENQFVRLKESLERELFEEAIRRGLEKSDILLMFSLKALNGPRFDDKMRQQSLINETTERLAKEVTVSKRSIQDVLDKLKAADPFVDYDTLLADETETTGPQ